MLAIAFDLVVANALAYRARGFPQPYTDICTTSAHPGFSRIQGCLYVSKVDCLVIH